MTDGNVVLCGTDVSWIKLPETNTKWGEDNWSKKRKKSDTCSKKNASHFITVFQLPSGLVSRTRDVKWYFWVKDPIVIGPLLSVTRLGVEWLLQPYTIFHWSKWSVFKLKVNLEVLMLVFKIQWLTMHVS